MKISVARGVSVHKGTEEVLVLGSGRKILRITGSDIRPFSEFIDLLEATEADGISLEQISEQLYLSSETVGELTQKCLELGVVEVASDPARHQKSLSENFLRSNFFANYFPGGNTHLDFLDTVLCTPIEVYGEGILAVEIVFQLASAGYSNVLVVMEDGVIDKLDAQNSARIPDRFVGRPWSEFLESTFSDYESLMSSFKFKLVSDLETCVETKRTSSSDKQPYTIVCLPQFDASLLRAINRRMVKNSSPWSFIAPILGDMSVMSFSPPFTACFHCLSKRLESNAMYLEEYKIQSKTLNREKVHQYFSSGVGIAVSFLITELFKTIPITGSRFQDILSVRETATTFEGYNSSIKHLKFGLPESWGALNTLKVSPFEVSSNTVLKLPRCPQCGVNSRTVPPALPWSAPL